MSPDIGKVITFYSYKGGTGRSMLLANLAWLLAANGQKVLAIDWDLEAPGLHRFFKPFLVDSDMTETDGLIDAFWALTTRAMSGESRASPSRTLDNEGFSPNSVDLEDFVTPLDWQFSGQGGIDLIGAGRQGGTYSERVNTFDWKYFYQIGGGALLDRAKESLTAQYNYVLIDSRTGVSDTSGICTTQMPDILVACLTLNRQSIEGVAAILASVRAWRKDSGQTGQERVTQRPELVIYPVATRIENSEKEKLDAARERVRKIFQPFLNTDGPTEAREYWDDMEVTYRPFYAYEEILAGFGDPSGAAGSAKTLLSEMEKIGRRVSGMPQLAMPQIPEVDRQRILAEYAFGTVVDRETGMEPSKDLHPDEVEFQRNIYAKEVQWRNEGFRYANLLSRRELQLITPDERTKFGRQMAFFHANSELVPKFREKTFVIFTYIWGGLLLLVTSPVWLSMIRRFGMESDPYFVSNVIGLGAVVFTIGIALGMLALYRSTSRPYGTALPVVVKLCLFGPLVPEIRDYRPG